jgi:hypothetical protein
MVKIMKPLAACTLIAAAAAITYSCSKNANAKEGSEINALKNEKGLALGLEKKLDLQNYSVTPALIKKLSGFEDIDITTMISSDDNFAGYRCRVCRWFRNGKRSKQ